ncbi:AtpZ/AtpI family protein [Vallitalea guaymasensis]
MKSLSLITQIGFLMAIPIIGCILFGNFLDRILSTGVLFLIIFTILGMLTAFRNLYVIAMKSSKKRKKDS